jgi:hypothetical protein
VPFLVWDSLHGRAVRELDRALVVIGRDPGCDLVLDDTTVSPRHVLVQVEDRVKITDLNSTAGTRINGAKVKPDFPCTLEPGDFLAVGRVVLSFHVAAPPPAPPSPPRAAPQLPWKPIGTALALVAVAGLGMFLALKESPRPVPPPAPVEVVRPPEPAPAPAPAVEPAPAPPPPSKPAEPQRAAAGELPPRGPAKDLPDLIEVDGKTYLPVKLKTLGENVEAFGADGRIYAIPMKRVTKIEDRADLARRLGVERRRLAPDDVAARVALADWCEARLLREEARALVREALSLKPEDPAARAALARLQEAE